MPTHRGIPEDGESRMTFIGDSNDRVTILQDAGIFFESYFAATDADEAAGIDQVFGPDKFPPYWPLGQQTSGLIQVHDLLAPADFATATVYLQRLGAIAQALLANRDDMRGSPEDPFRGRVMPAWGAFTPDRDNKWNTDVSTSGLFVYAMAAFARRVSERPDQYPLILRDQAIRMITAGIETYEAFRPELHLVEGDPHAFYVLPERYRALVCAGGNHSCENYRNNAGKPIAYNESLSMIKALTELAPAADSSLYRASTDATPIRLQLATEEMPLVIAKTIAFRIADLHPRTLSDGTPYYEWGYEGNDGAEDIHHAQFELGLPGRRPRRPAAAQRNARALRTLRARAARLLDVRTPGEHLSADRVAGGPAHRKDRRIWGRGQYRRVRRVGAAGAVRPMGVDPRS